MVSTDPPTHIAIILDGNRRWATEHGMPKIMGHTEGAKRIKPVALSALHQGVSFLTLFVLSTENVKERSQTELDHLYTLFGKIIDYVTDLNEHNVRLNVIGDISKLPQKVQDNLQQAMERTKNNTGLMLTFAANYGGRDEMTRAVKKMIVDGVDEPDITEDTISRYLDTAGMPDVDLLIRTSGHQRTSNFLPWQSVYAELYFPRVHWPAFGEEDLLQAIFWFKEQKRNKGK
ncbi:MAG: di-trans,poly-cis-decaprenylcistransferase [Candidatus Magasanikbacteria bacterium CG10_big_fil_rev_8_21_14_0_10_47_10]|uniref:Isoprenyl transferase n=1 Tax=Candidatus Magasanikbacteria bacterium CG10_big_fil_rev_8_21_14_0_10_47_10 TaxID=1974652 RepID=A0A2H0TQ77_9BACT|nr:MAG: di-trans,poly-cis-decaprenylcistransferase [Candidatus Magasanikbacteria bacterium CG10_big_fil_rev_8_21_14_0_10_47_10]